MTRREGRKYSNEMELESRKENLIIQSIYTYPIPPEMIMHALLEKEYNAGLKKCPNDIGLSKIT